MIIEWMSDDTILLSNVKQYFSNPDEKDSRKHDYIVYFSWVSFGGERKRDENPDQQKSWPNDENLRD